MMINDLVTKYIKVYGVVQAVGFRPTVSRYAMAAGVAGTVCNRGPFVEIYAQGENEAVDEFIGLIEKKPPKRAAILRIIVKAIDDAPVYDGFQIIESKKTDGEIFISPDIAICDECKKELFDKADRRYHHPFINCTSCGPRLTILEGLPYDRERTSMKHFPLCEKCAAEYHNPKSRRYDAQPVCCNDCGPSVYLLGGTERGRAAITKARQIIKDGGIVAIKGIGGFHLACDATNESAVAKLRERKKRPSKPFAVMAKDFAAASREIHIESDNLKEILTGHQKPILLLEKKTGGRIAANVAPQNSRLGVMLPYAPLQLLLFDYDDGIAMPVCLVMTSANDSGAPIVKDDTEAAYLLENLADAVLSHDREIRIRADDSVAAVFDDEIYMVRRSRGYAPLPFLVSGGITDNAKKKSVLAIGGELKNSFCVAMGELYYPSPYIGDLADMRTVEALRECVKKFAAMLEIKPTAVVCDLHPLYNSSLIAAELAEEYEIPLIKIQHHYAHILAVMAENDYLQPVIGLSLDGTGYGTDGAVWGGEILICDTQQFSRLGSIAPFPQTGGDLAAKEIWRNAVGILAAVFGRENFAEAATINEKLNLLDAKIFQIIYNLCFKERLAVKSASAGRLFDAVSAALGICRTATFEGEAAMKLQYFAEKYLAEGGDDDFAEFLALDNLLENSASVGNDCQPQFSLNTNELFINIVKARLNNIAIEKIAYYFHCALAAMLVSAAKLAREKTKLNAVALSGGTWQNTLLLKLVTDGLKRENFKILRHKMMPPNDGGICLGQALYGMFN